MQHVVTDSLRKSSEIYKKENKISHSEDPCHMSQNIKKCKDTDFQNAIKSASVR